MMAKNKAESKAEVTADNQDNDKRHRGEGGVVAGIIQLVLVVVFIIGSFFISATLKSNKKEVVRHTSEARVLFAKTKLISPAPYQINFETTGVVAARSDISISPQISGNVVAVNDVFFEGGRFEAGEVLFEIEPLDFELEIRRLQSSVAQARTAFNLEEAESAAAAEEWEQINGDRPVPALVARKPQKAAAWANLKAAKAQLENAQLDLDRTKFSLPFAGRVLSANIEAGQFVSAGQSYGSVYDTKNLEVQVSLNDDQLNWLMQSEMSEQDSDIRITYEHFVQVKTYDGFLKRGVSSLNSQTRFASVSFGFKDAPEDLLPGVFVTIDIEGPRIDNAFSIPVNALQKSNEIWAVRSDNTLYQPGLKTVFNNDKHVVMTGADDPINVVISKLPGAIDGMAVRTSQDADKDMDASADE